MTDNDIRNEWERHFADTLPENELDKAFTKVMSAADRREKAQSEIMRRGIRQKIRKIALTCASAAAMLVFVPWATLKINDKITDSQSVAGRRGFLSSFHYVTLVGGHVLAQLTLLLMLYFLDTTQISEWGWRLAFGIGGLGAVVVFWLRRSMDESLAAEDIAAARSGQARRNGSLRELLLVQWRPLLLCIGITMGGTLAFYTYSVIGPKLVQGLFAGGDVITGVLINLAALTLLMLLQPLGGWLSDIVGRKSLLVFFGIGGVLYTGTLLTALPQTGHGYSAFALLSLGFVILTGYTSINAVVKAELFPAHVRALGVGLGYALANSTFGGTAPLLYQAALGHGRMDAFILYATVLIALSLLVYVLCLKNHAPTWLDHDGH